MFLTPVRFLEHPFNSLLRMQNRCISLFFTRSANSDTALQFESKIVHEFCIRAGRLLGLHIVDYDFAEAAVGGLFA